MRLAYDLVVVSDHVCCPVVPKDESGGEPSTATCAHPEKLCMMAGRKGPTNDFDTDGSRNTKKGSSPVCCMSSGAPDVGPVIVMEPSELISL